MFICYLLRGKFEFLIQRRKRKKDQERKARDEAVRQKKRERKVKRKKREREKKILCVNYKH